MTYPDLQKIIHILLVASLLIGLGPTDASAQSPLKKDSGIRLQIDGVKGEDTIQRGGSGKTAVPGVGKIFFPGDHFTRAFPGDHFTPRQVSALNAQGIQTIAQFLQSDAAVIARVTGTNARTVTTWQGQIAPRVRDR